MRFIPFILLDLALLFFGFTVYVVLDAGLVEAFSTVFQSLTTLQMTGDIVLGLGSASALMVLDSRRTGIKVGRYLLATLFLGAPGPLLYLARRFWVLNKA